MENELITIETLPVIRVHLEQLAVEIKEKVSKIEGLVVNEDTVKETKKLRAELDKEFKELESQRFAVKHAIMEKYDEFEKIYNECVKDIYGKADSDLKEKINSVEDKLKLEKEEVLREFAKQHFEDRDIENIVKFEDIGLNITLSASMKSLKDKVLEFVDKVDNDLKLIQEEEYGNEILLEYKNTLDFTKAKTRVVERKKELEKLELQQEFKEDKKALEQTVIDQVDEITAPVEIDEELYTVSFRVTGSKDKIRKIRDFIIEMGLEYE